MVSVIGLAPIRLGLKIRPRELLCIHGLKMVPEVGIAPTSPRLQRGANLPQLLGVLAHGQNWSSRQVTLLRLPVISRVLVAVCKHLLSYETSSSCGFTPNRRIGRKVTLDLAAGRMRTERFGL